MPAERRTFWRRMLYLCDRCGYTVPFLLEDGCEGPRGGGSEAYRLPLHDPFEPGKVVEWEKTPSGRLIVPVPFVAGGCPKCQGPPPWHLEGPCLMHAEWQRDLTLAPPLAVDYAGFQEAHFAYPPDPRAPQACGIPSGVWRGAPAQA